MYRVLTHENGVRKLRMRDLSLKQAQYYLEWFNSHFPEITARIEYESEENVDLPATAQEEIKNAFNGYLAGLDADELRKLALQQHGQLVNLQYQQSRENPEIFGDIRLTPKGNGAFEVEIHAEMSNPDRLSDFLFGFAEALNSIAS